MKLAVPIAKSAISLIPTFPKSWEVVVADCSRSDAHQVTFWSMPRCNRYEEILVLERRASTGLTQRRVAAALSDLGVQGPVRLVASEPETNLAYRHQDYLLKEGVGVLPRPAEPPPELGDRYLIALSGLSGSGKTLIRYLLAEMGISCYKWGSALADAYAEYEGSERPSGPPSWEEVVRFHQEVETWDRVAVARIFLASSGVQDDPAPFVLLDGVKSREQLIYVAYALRRPVILIAVGRDEAERVGAVHSRGDQDDRYDQQRRDLLCSLGTFQLMGGADFVVETTGSETTYDRCNRRCSIRFSKRFIEGLHQVLSWILLSGSWAETEQRVREAAEAVAERRGYLPTVEVF